MKPLALSIVAFGLAACNAGNLSTNSMPGVRTFSGLGSPAKSVFRVVHSFQATPSDGSYPSTGLVASNGVLYGGTSYGGKRVNCNGSVECGTVYAIMEGSSNDRLLHTFSGPPSDGLSASGVVSYNGGFYGTTQFGGTNNVGTVFQLTPAPHHPNRWIESVIYNFKGPPDGADIGSLIVDSSGILYGTSFMGGSSSASLFQSSGCGAIFELAPPGPGKKNWKESILHSFGGAPDGAAPLKLIWDGDTIYGTTQYGGTSTQCPYVQGCGTLFTLKKSGRKGGWSETVVHSFNVGGSSKADGSLPSGALVVAKNGTIYGTTQYGGGKGLCNVEKGLIGCGVLYAVTGGRGRSSADVTVVYAFGGAPTDGAQPDSFVANGSRGFFGVTVGGGSGNCDAYEGCGTIYELQRPKRGTAPWKERVLHDFVGYPTDGEAPGTDVVLDNGTLYGVTDLGGSGPCPFGCGILFSLTP